jgi:GNAT superfamily N-acetyltransferase
VPIRSRLRHRQAEPRRPTGAPTAPRAPAAAASVRRVQVRIATLDDVRAIALLRWETAAAPAQPREQYARAFSAWAVDVAATHTAFAAVDEDALIGSAWLAVTPRTPDPGPRYRANGDLQTVFVVPERRDDGVGEALVRAVLAHAWRQGLDAVTVAANTRAASLYRRVGFTGDPLDLRMSRPED